MKRMIFFAMAVFAFCNSGYAQNGVLTTFAGTGASGFSGDGGQAILATMDTPKSVIGDRFGNIYINTGERIRKVSPSGIITTIAGTGVQAYGGDGGPAISATFRRLSAIGIDNGGNIYCLDAPNIRKINGAGIISTIAGTGSYSYSGDGGPASSAALSPMDIAVDGSGNVYIADGINNRIRKISTTGIITTIAGTTTGGYSGDGGPATAAQIAYPQGIAVDGIGNVYFSGDSRVRKISSAGIITTIAGTGTSGYSGDGKHATMAQLNYPWGLNVDKHGNVFIADWQNARIREVKKADGKIITIAGNGNAYSYTDGGFAITSSINPKNNIWIDTMGDFYVADFLNKRVRIIKQTAEIVLYVDGNNNCILDSVDYSVLTPSVLQIDSNNVVIDTISATSGFTYYTRGHQGDIYTFKMLSAPIGLTSSCPVTGKISDTIYTTNGNFFSGNIGFQCIGSGFDLKVDAFARAGYHAEIGNIYVTNGRCTPTNGTVTLTFSPKHVFYGAIPTPTSQSGNTVTWDVFSLSNAVLPEHIYYHLEIPIGASPLPIGDTVTSNVAVTPVSGDANPVNNAMIIVDTVKSGFDPNEMDVVPSGLITPGVVTNLEYTIQFENTGNDTAFNIYIIDSLSDYVDPKSFRIVAASAVMNTTMLHSSVHNILKFDFPDINLLDSSHHGECDGFVKFTINTRPGLALGTNIFNHAGIYFDDNPVVVTNTVQDSVAFPAKAENIDYAMRFEIYPNPATDELTIKTQQNSYSSFTIANVMGQVLIEQPLTGVQTKTSVKMLPPGMYYVTVSGANGVKVEKFIKR